MCSEFYFDQINIVENNILHIKIIFYSVSDSTTRTDLLWWTECSKFKSLCTWKSYIWWLCLCMLIIVQCSGNSLWSNMQDLHIIEVVTNLLKGRRLSISMFTFEVLNFGMFIVYRFQVKPIHISMSGGYVTGIVFWRLPWERCNSANFSTTFSVFSGLHCTRTCFVFFFIQV